MTGIKRGVGHGQTREGARQYLHVLYGGGWPGREISTTVNMGLKLNEWGA
jgi:hypothetical protein